MGSYKNPVYPAQRGCFINPTTASKDGPCEVVDYPTHLAKAGVVSACSTSVPVTDGEPYTADFPTRAKAVEFCREQNLVICQHPDDVKRAAALMDKGDWNENNEE